MFVTETVTTSKPVLIVVHNSFLFVSSPKSKRSVPAPEGIDKALGEEIRKLLEGGYEEFTIIDGSVTSLHEGVKDES